MHIQYDLPSYDLSNDTLQCTPRLKVTDMSVQS